MGKVPASASSHYFSSVEPACQLRPTALKSTACECLPAGETHWRSLKVLKRDGLLAHILNNGWIKKWGRLNFFAETVVAARG